MTTDFSSPRPWRAPRRPLAHLGLATCLVMSAGCQDSPSGPMSGVQTVETVPSLSLSGPLPELTELASRAAATPSVRGAVEAWSASWDDPEGEDSRYRSRQVVAGHLVQVLDARGVEEAFRSLMWMETEVGDLAALPPALVAPLDRARRLAQESGEARRDGDLRTAIEQGLAAADLYRSVTPEAVARSLVARAERRVEQETEAHEDGPSVDTEPGSVDEAGGTGAASEAVLQRAVHLAEGARRALDDGEHSLAIQRAFYAIQVLDGRMVDPEL